MTSPEQIAAKLTKAQRIVRLLTFGEVRECVDSILRGDRWLRKGNEFRRANRYPMGFYLDDPNLYFARGWGAHVALFWHERWLIRGLAVRTILENEHDPR